MSPVAACAAGVERLTLGPVRNPVRGFLHGSASIAALTIAFYLWSHPGCPESTRVALVLCALSHFGLYLTSSLYHSMPWGPIGKHRMQRADHSMIYLAIAGSVTPIALLGLEDWRREAIPVAAWTIAVLGIAQKVFWPQVHEKASIPFQVLAACLAIPALGPFAERCAGVSGQLAAFAAVSFSVGAFCFVTERPRLWPRVFSFHEVFHLCTVAGSGAHFALLVRYLSQVG